MIESHNCPACQRGDFCPESYVSIHADLAEALSLLRGVEWVWDTGLEEEWCDVCDRRKTDGHDPDCRLAAFLARHPAEDERSTEVTGQCPGSTVLAGERMYCQAKAGHPGPHTTWKDDGDPDSVLVAPAPVKP